MTRGPAARACEGKVRYDTETDAITAARGLERRRGLQRYTLTVYRCDYCRRWHYGHATIRERLRRGTGLAARRKRHRR